MLLIIVFGLVSIVAGVMLLSVARSLGADTRGTLGLYPQGGASPVADLGVLANSVPVATLPEGSVVYVISVQAYFRLALASGAPPVTGQVVQAFGGPAAARWIVMQGAGTPTSAADAAGILTMLNGDSLTTGSAVGGPGASLAALLTTTRKRGINVRAFGPIANPAGFGAGLTASYPYEAWCAGYSGFKIEDVTALWGGTPTVSAPAPLLQQFVATSGAPDVICLMIGTNNASAGETAAAMEAKLTTCLAQITTVCPLTRVIVETIPSFYAPAAPTGGLAAANAVVASYNLWILQHINGLANITPLGPLYSAIDVAAGQSQATTNPPDGIHLNETGQAYKGQLEGGEVARLFPARTGLVSPRVFKPRARQASAHLPVKGTSQIVTAADNGWRLPAGNFLLGGRVRILDFAAGVNYVFTAYPTAGSFNTGWALIFNGTSLKWDFDFLGNVVLDELAPMTLGLPIWVFVHGDRVNGTITLWMAMPLSQSAAQPTNGGDLPSVPYVVSCVGAVSGVAAWAQAAANPLFSAGTDPSTRAGVAMDVDSVFFCGAVGVPDVFHIRDTIEAVVYDGASPPGLTAMLPCNEGTGATCASSDGGANGVLTGAWSLAGEIAWPSDVDSGSTPYLSTSVAMADANQVLASTAFGCTTIECTGALSADRNLQLPREQGKIWIINNKTTGSKNVVAIGLTGAGFPCPLGISAVYFDGTNYVKAAPENVVTGTFVLNGVTQVDVPGNFPIGATISWSLATVGGTPGAGSPYFSAAQTAGHFFVKSPTALANDTYNWRASW